MHACMCAAHGPVTERLIIVNDKVLVNIINILSELAATWKISIPRVLSYLIGSELNLTTTTTTKSYPQDVI